MGNLQRRAALALLAVCTWACDDGDTPGDPLPDAFIRDMPVLPMAECGNGMIEDGEGCDDGNLEDGDGCSSTCQVEPPAPVCGNSAVEDGEGCDDGNTDAGDGCDASCQVEEPAPVCGDGTQDDGEECDDGNTDAGDGCDADCRTEAPPISCGNGTVDEGEECDDGNVADGDGCDANCQLEAVDPVCGNGTVEEGEGCDDGNTDAGDGCDADCQFEPEPACGDGAIDDDEECDDGNTEAGDGCDANCQVEPACGDGTLDAGEGCDDGNTDDGDGCDANCQPEPECGDGIQDAGEECDDGNDELGDGCDNDCRLEPACGDGTVDAGEGCDDGNLIDGDGCDANCQVEPACGDGNLDDGEGCDDGNTDGGDGCDANCQPEPECGDGVLDAGEECDDGNLQAGDECDAECDVEPVDISDGGDFPGRFVAGSLDRFIFTLDADADADLSTICPPGVDLRLTLFRRDVGGLAQVAVAADGCGAIAEALAAGDYVLIVDSPEGRALNYQLTAEFTFAPPPECGNGVVEEGESCDDGNLNDGDGCSALCVSEACGDGVLQADEECDEGDVIGGDGCDDRCRVETIDISAGGMFAGSFQTGSFDRYRFELAEESTVRLATGDGAGDCPGDINLAVAAGGAEVVRADGGGCGAIEQVLPAGVYQVVVDGPEGVDYQLTAAFIPVLQAVCGDRQIQDEEECDDGNADVGDGCDADCIVEAVDITAGGQFFGSFVARSLDRYVFVLDGTADVTLLTGDGVGGCPGDTDLTLWNDLGEQIGAAADGAVAPCAGITQTLPAGRYTVIVRGADEQAVGAYFLDASYRFERAPGEACDVDEVLDRCAEPAECRGEPALCRVGDCGDGVVDVGEDCDDGNLDAGDGCDALCRTEVCGNGRIEGAEECDDGNLAAGDGCDANCVSELVCGDGDIDDGEECDDGNLIDGDGCDANCQREPACGDGTVDEGEGCDDGNLIDGDGCDAGCQLEPACGDGTVDEGEECDDGNLVDGDGCDANCQVEPACGDGNLDPGEECDDGNVLGSDGCDPQCQREPQCGDGVLDPNEECDDGNLINGDGCDVVCNIEVPDPDPVCGDGELDADTEQCDDGNLVAGDGCDSLCTFEIYDVNLAFTRFFGAMAADTDDRFRFTVEATGNLFVESNDGQGGCPAGVDTVFTLNRIDVPGQIATDDDGGEGTCSRIQQVLQPGEYELVVTGFDDRAVTGYLLTHQLIADVTVGGLFGGGFTAGGDDAFVINLDAASDVRIATTDGADGCPGDTEIELFSVSAEGQLELVETISDGAVAPCAGLDQELAAGTWILFVSGAAGAAVEAYTLEVERGTCGDGVVEGAEACDDGNLVNGDGCDALCTQEAYDLVNAESVIVERVPAGGTDTYRFTVDDESFLFAATDGPQGGCPGDTELVLYRIDGANRVEVGRNDDGPTPPCSVLQNNALPAGDYELDVTAPAELTYRLLVFHTVIINALGDYDGLIAAGGDDNFSFGINAATDLVIGTGDGNGGCPIGQDTVMQIFSVDANGARALVVESDDEGPGLCSQVSQNFAPGNYEIVVTGFDAAAVAAYVLSFELP